MPYSKSGNNERLTSTLRLHQTYSHFGVLRWKSGVAVDAFHVHLHRVTQRSPTERERITKNQPGATTQRSEGRKTWLRRLSLVSYVVRTLYLDLSYVNLQKRKLPETQLRNVTKTPFSQILKYQLASIRISCSSAVHVKTESMAIAMHPTRDAKQLGECN